MPRFEGSEEVHSTTGILAVFLEYGDPRGIARGRQARLDQSLADGWIARLRSIEEIEHTAPGPFLLVHPATTRCRGGDVALLQVANQCFGAQDHARDAGGILECTAGDLGRIDDAGLHQVNVAL